VLKKPSSNPVSWLSPLKWVCTTYKIINHPKSNLPKVEPQTSLLSLIFSANLSGTHQLLMPINHLRTAWHVRQKQSNQVHYTNMCSDAACNTAHTNTNTHTHIMLARNQWQQSFAPVAAAEQQNKRGSVGFCLDRAVEWPAARSGRGRSKHTH
jgi:hypothetical protein